MTTTAADLALNNLAHTYAALARQVPDAHLWETRAHTSCIGQLSHGICNFAVVKELDESVLNELLPAAQTRRVFNLYLSGEEAAAKDDLLSELGFALSFQLVQMVADPAYQPTASAITDGADRQDVAAFMVRQFFPGLSGPTKNAVISATAGAAELRLLELREHGRLIAAAMTSESAGMAGLYNLCVDYEYQHRGIGTGIVESLLSEAGAKKLPIALQCDERLERWYAGLGFVAVGTVDVFVLSNGSPGVIMN